MASNLNIADIKREYQLQCSKANTQPLKAVLIILDQHGRRKQSSITFNLSGKSLDFQGITALAATFSHSSFTPSIKALDLSNNKLDSRSCKPLSGYLRIAKHLVTLDLSSNIIGDNGTRQILDGLITNSTLTALYLRDTQLTEKSLHYLSNYLVHSTSLKDLNLSVNASLFTNTSSSAPIAGEKSSFSSPVVDAGVSGADVFIGTLKLSSTLTSLNLSNCRIPIQASEALISLSRTSRCLTHLDLKNTQLKEKDVTKVNEGMKRNHKWRAQFQLSVKRANEASNGWLGSLHSAADVVDQIAGPPSLRGGGLKGVGSVISIEEKEARAFAKELRDITNEEVQKLRLAYEAEANQLRTYVTTQIQELEASELAREKVSSNKMAKWTAALRKSEEEIVELKKQLGGTEARVEEKEKKIERLQRKLDGLQDNNRKEMEIAKKRAETREAYLKEKISMMATRLTELQEKVFFDGVRRRNENKFQVRKVGGTFDGEGLGNEDPELSEMLAKMEEDLQMLNTTASPSADDVPKTVSDDCYEELENTRTRNSELEKKNAEQEWAMKEMSAQIGELKEELLCLQNGHADMELQERLAQAQQEIAGLKEELTHLPAQEDTTGQGSTKEEELMEINVELLRLVEVTQAELASAKGYNQKLVEDNQTQALNTEDLYFQIGELKKQLEFCALERSIETDTKLEELQANVQEWKRKYEDANTSLTADSVQLNDLLTSARQEQDKWESKYTKAKSRNQTKTTKIETLTIANAQLQQKWTDLSQEMTSWKEKYETERSEKKDKKAMMAHLKASTESNIEELTNKIGSLQETISQQLLELATWKKKYEDALTNNNTDQLTQLVTEKEEVLKSLNEQLQHEQRVKNEAQEAWQKELAMAHEKLEIETKQNEAVCAENGLLLGRLKETQTSSEQKETSLAELTALAENYRRKLNTADETNKKLQQNTNTLEQKEASYMQEVELLKKHIEEMKTAKENAEVTVSSRDQQYSELIDEVSKWKADYENECKKLNEKELEIKELEGLFGTAKLEIAGLVQRVEQILLDRQTEIDKLEQEISQLTLRLEALQKQLDNDTKQWNEQSAMGKSRVEELQQQADSSQQRVAELTSLSDQYKNKYSDELKEKQQIELQMKKHLGQVQGLEKSLDGKISELESLNGKYAQSERDKQLLQSEILILKTEVNKEMDKFEQFKTFSIQKDDEIKELESKVEELTQKGEGYRRQLEDALLENSRMKRRTQQNVLGLQEKTDLVEKLKLEIAELNVKIGEMKQRITELTKTDVVLSGWMQKQGRVVRSWKQRFFTLLNTGELKYYDKQLPDPRGVVYTYNIAKIEQVYEKGKTKYSFVVQIYGSEREYLFSCKDQEELDLWVNKLKEISDNLLEKKGK